MRLKLTLSQLLLAFMVLSCTLDLPRSSMLHLALAPPKLQSTLDLTGYACLVAKANWTGASPAFTPNNLRSGCSSLSFEGAYSKIYRASDVQSGALMTISGIPKGTGTISATVYGVRTNTSGGCRIGESAETLFRNQEAPDLRALGTLTDTAITAGTELRIQLREGGADPDVSLTPGQGAVSSRCRNFWGPVQTTGAPSARIGHSAVWTGKEVIIWGGRNISNTSMQSGALYDPSKDTWRDVSLTGAPSAREDHTAIWTGTEMIVWGGTNHQALVEYDDGARYNPESNTWSPMSSSGAPAGRHSHTAVWTGSKMMVWGGLNTVVLNSGAVYEPSSDQWTTISTTGAPSVRHRHSAVWTGTEMIVWGGTGATLGSTPVRDDGSAFGTAWGSTFSLSYNARSIRAVLSEREHPSAVWTGSEVLVWGGKPESAFATNTGARYDPALTTSSPNATAIPTTAAPAARWRHVAFWTGSRMVVWGGDDGGGANYLTTGGLYHLTGGWSSTETTGAPTGRVYFAAVSMGSAMFVWGGQDSSGWVGNGGIYTF